MSPRKSSSTTGSTRPRTVKEALQTNVRRQQERAPMTASPPEAQRSPRERTRSAERRKAGASRTRH